jgi:two-component system chemotaxis sensor kinase CheA
VTIDREAFLDGFLAETEEHVAAVTRHLTTIEQGAGAPRPREVREVFRSLHTIKGLSAMVGVEPIVELAHGMEAIVRAADVGGGRLTPTQIDLLAQGVRAIDHRLRAVAQRQPVPPPPRALVDAFGSAEAGPVVAVAGAAPTFDDPEGEKLTASERQQIAEGLARGLRCSRLEFTPTRERLAAGLNITTVRERVATIGELVRVVPKSVPRDAASPGGLAFVLFVLHAGDDAALAAAAGLDPSSVVPVAGATAPAVVDAGPDLPDDTDGFARGVIRVEVSRLDDALERLSALIVTRYRMGRAIAELAARGVDTRRLDETMAESSRHLRDLRAAIMRARMVSVAELLERVPLMVRGLARATGKSVSVSIEAGRAELDKAVGERIFPAIVHLIRNAVDHAIEPPEERRARGKPAEGKIAVACHDRANHQLELTIADDGRGVDREAVARRAGKPVPTTNEGLLELLATPGLSTLAEATTTSGRGLGVDIVQRIVRDLGGELRLDTWPGQGTAFTLRVPLSITIVDSFSFVAAGHTFVVPVAAVEEIVEIDPARTTKTPQLPGAGAEVRLIERRGVAVPLLQLDEVFALQREAPEPATGLHRKAIVVRRGGAPYAFGVDRMLGQQEVVVRPVIDPLVRVPGVAGSTDLGDGKPVLVLDLIQLSERVAADATRRSLPP